MPRRTGLDTIFDNELTMTGEELRELAEAQGDPSDFPEDPEDYNQRREGLPGEYGNRGEDREPMSDEEFENAISAAITKAEDYIDMQLSPDREEAAKFYRGDKFGNEVEGRSAFVMSEVRDTVLALMPALLRIFCGTREAVEFTSQPGTPGEQGMQQTAYVSHIFHKDNPGFMLHFSAFKDALVRKTGIYTWWHEEIETVECEEKTGLNEAAYALEQLEVQESSSENHHIQYEIEVLDERPDTTEQGEDPLQGVGVEGILPGELAGMAEPMSFIRDIKIYKRTIVKKHRVDVVPPEEFILTPIASSDIDRFPLVGRRQMKTIGDLVAMGHDEELIRDKIGGTGGAKSRGSNLQLNVEAVDRQPAVTERLFDNEFATVDPQSEYVKYCEVYVLIDQDGDGILERRKICTVGDNNHIIYNEMSGGMVPYALICPDPEPHTPFGYSVADHNMDFQEVKSEIVRAMIDNLAQAIIGRMAIVEGKVNIDDALSNDREQVIRMKEPGAIQQLSHPFNGQNAIPVLAYLDQVQTKRTGININSTGGLSADVLQSTPNVAAEQMVESTHERAEMIARIFAETGIKRLYRGLLQNVLKHQDVKKVLRLRGREVTVDPRTFNADLDLEVNVGLGRGTNKKRIAALTAVGAKQQEIYEKYGPGNPMVTLVQICNLAEDWISEHEIGDVGRYFTRVTPEQEAEINKAHAEKKPPPSPEQLLFDAQMAKIQSDSAAKQRGDMIKFAIEVAKLAQKEDADESTFYLKAAELLGKFGIEVNEQEMRIAQMTDDSADKLVQAASSEGAARVQQPQAGAQPNGSQV